MACTQPVSFQVNYALQALKNFQRALHLDPSNNEVCALVKKLIDVNLTIIDDLFSLMFAAIVYNTGNLYFPTE